MSKPRRRLCVPAVLLVFCILIPLLAAGLASSAFDGEEIFSGIDLVIAPEAEDPMTSLFCSYLENMDDIGDYCSVRVMDAAGARDALTSGLADGAVLLPQGFVEGVMNGDNPDVLLLVDGSDPVSQLLLFGIASAAADILSSAQEGIYAVLDAYREIRPAGLDWNTALLDINMEYLSVSLSRSRFFSLERVSPASGMSLKGHYFIGTALYLVMCLGPIYASAFFGDLSHIRRLRAAGSKGSAAFFAAVCSAFISVLPAVFAAGAVFLRIEQRSFEFAPLIAAACAASVFIAAAESLLALFCGNPSTCFAVSFAFSLAFLALSGGILPVSLLPAAVQRVSSLSPVSMMRTAFNTGRLSSCLLLLSVSALLMLLAFILYKRKLKEAEA